MSETLTLPAEKLPDVRGKLTQHAPLAKLVWFKAGGAADWLFEPADVDDLCAFVRDLDPSVPLLPLGLGSNLIVRDGGVPGVTIRLGKSFAKIETSGDHTLHCGAGAHGVLIASTARDNGIAGLEFLRGIPGTLGGFVRMNGGAYGRETADVLVDCDVVLRDGSLKTLPVAELGYTYRHSQLPEGAVVVAARATPSRSARRWSGSRRRARKASPCGPRPAAPPSRTLRARRHGSWSMRRAVAE